MIASWQLDLITTQANEDTWQSASMGPGDLDGYHAHLLDMVRNKRAILLSYKEYSTVFWVHLRTDYVAEFHVFSDGGVFKLASAFRRFMEDVWIQCPQVRVEARVRKPVLQAILERTGVVVEGTRYQAWFDQATQKMIDEKVYALHRPA